MQELQEGFKKFADAVKEHGSPEELSYLVEGGEGGSRLIHPLEECIRN